MQDPMRKETANIMNKLQIPQLVVHNTPIFRQKAHQTQKLSPVVVLETVNQFVKCNFIIIDIASSPTPAHMLDMVQSTE